MEIHHVSSLQWFPQPPEPQPLHVHRWTNHLYVWESSSQGGGSSKSSSIICKARARKVSQNKKRLERNIKYYHVILNIYRGLWSSTVLVHRLPWWSRRAGSSWGLNLCFCFMCRPICKNYSLVCLADVFRLLLISLLLADSTTNGQRRIYVIEWGVIWHMFNFIFWCLYVNSWRSL